MILSIRSLLMADMPELPVLRPCQMVIIPMARAQRPKTMFMSFSGKDEGGDPVREGSLVRIPLAVRYVWGAMVYARLRFKEGIFARSAASGVCD